MKCILETFLVSEDQQAPYGAHWASELEEILQLLKQHELSINLLYTKINV